MTAESDEDRRSQEWYDHKSSWMEEILGKEHDMVMHAIIPYAIGGGLDLYYYPNGISGTAVATKELSELPNQGSPSDAYSCYELVMFTKHPINMNDELKEPKTPFGKIHRTFNSVLNLIARYSAEATLNPTQTCEFPAEMEEVGGRCFIFADYGSHADEAVENFGLLAIIEVFRSEMDFAREIGGEQLIELLKKSGHYPYSDLDREPVA